MQKKRFQRNNNFANVVATLLLAVLFILDPGTGHLGRSIIAISDAQAEKMGVDPYAYRMSQGLKINPVGAPPSFAHKQFKNENINK